MPNAVDMCNYDCKLCIWFCLHGPSCTNCGTGSRSGDFLDSSGGSPASLGYVASKGDESYGSTKVEDHGDQVFTVDSPVADLRGEPRMQTCYVGFSNSIKPCTLIYTHVHLLFTCKSDGWSLKETTIFLPL